MTDFIESTVGENGKILIEVTDNRGHVGFGAQKTADEKKETASNAFSQAMDTIQVAAQSVLDTLNGMEHQPNHVKIDFAIKIDPSHGAMLARADSRDSQLRVSLGWNTPTPKDDEPEENESANEDE